MVTLIFYIHHSSCVLSCAYFISAYIFQVFLLLYKYFTHIFHDGAFSSRIKSKKLIPVSLLVFIILFYRIIKSLGSKQSITGCQAMVRNKHLVSVNHMLSKRSDGHGSIVEENRRRCTQWDWIQIHAVENQSLPHSHIYVCGNFYAFILLLIHSCGCGSHWIFINERERRKMEKEREKGER